MHLCKRSGRWKVSDAERDRHQRSLRDPSDQQERRSRTRSSASSGCSHSGITPTTLTPGDEPQFRRIHEAYLVLSDPEKRAQYDIFHDTFQKERWQFVAAGPPADNDFALEQHLRFVVLEILYSRRRTEPDKPSLSNLDLSRLTGRPRASGIHDLVFDSAGVDFAERSVEPHDYGNRRRLRRGQPLTSGGSRSASPAATSGNDLNPDSLLSHGVALRRHWY